MTKRKFKGAHLALLSSVFIACTGTAELSFVPRAEIHYASSLQWLTNVYVKPHNTAAGSQFGYSVAIDGDTAVVGALSEGGSGAAYVFKRNGISWSQEAYLKAPAGFADPGDNFGASVAISGDTLVVGATSEDSDSDTIINGTTADAGNTAGQAGAAYVFRRSGTTWTQEAYLKAPNSDANDLFGISVAISGDTIAVGASGERSNVCTIINGPTASGVNDGTFASWGAVYVFRRTGVNWAQEAYLKPSNCGGSDEFGYSVGIDGDTIVAGAYREDSSQTTITNGAAIPLNNSAADAGAAYIFKRTGVNWAEEAYLKAPNAEANDFFGWSVAIAGDTVVVGAYAEDSNQFTITNGTTASGNNLALGSGAAYVFKRTGVNWAQEAYLKPPNTNTNDRFGYNVALSGDTVLVGSDQEQSTAAGVRNGESVPFLTGAPNSGAAYLFRRSGTTWKHEAYFKPFNTATDDNLGRAVAVSGETVILGVAQEDSNQAGITAAASTNNSSLNAGAAYIYRRVTVISQ
jgi:hypothetical protein